ncbi:MAG: hypothetical protein H6600_01955 [Flavobacteriales bacterium]|nr:hypothetical protein [Flavobacteriales bacterium]MCB9197194.1 hypothetical protein [Flavobacteriales bacterium]
MRSKHILIATAALAMTLGACTKNKGEITMTYSKATAVYGNIEEIRNTPLIAPVRSIDNPGKIYVGDKFILIGEKEVGIHVFDNTDPNNPTAVTFIQLPMNREFFVDGDYLYAESQYDFVKINLSDFYNPSLIDREVYAFGTGQKNENGEEIIGFTFATVTESIEIGSEEEKALKTSTHLYYNYLNELIPVSSVPSSFSGVGEEGRGTLNKIATMNDYVYVVGNNKMYVFADDNNDLIARNVVHLNSWDVETIYPNEGNLYIGTQSSMILMNTNNPENPSEVSSYFHPTSCDPVLPNGDVAYLTLRSADNSGCAGDENTLTILNMEDEKNPTPLNSIVMNSPYGMTISGNYLWVGEGTNGLSLFDNSNPFDPVLIKTFTDVEAYDVIANPAIPNGIYVTGSEGMDHYNVDYQQLSLSAQGRINY